MTALALSMQVNNYHFANMMPFIEGHCSVVEAVHVTTGRKFAVKIVPLCNQFKKDSFTNETQILHMMQNCDGVVKMEEFFVKDNKGYIVLERMSCDLMSLIEHNQLSVKTRMNIFRSVCKTIRECHNHNIAHLDIKPENILVSSDYSVIRLCDFGCSHILTKSKKILRQGGTLMYSAPESFSGVPLDGKKADVWSLGILLHVLLTDHWPIEARNQSELMGMLHTGQLSMHASMPKDQESLFLRMTKINPTERMSVNKLCKVLKGDSIFSKLIHKIPLIN